LIAIDNVNGELGGDKLAQAIRRPTISIHVLGHSMQVTIEADGTSIFITGNNIDCR
jgi:hypothetical protein